MSRELVFAPMCAEDLDAVTAAEAEASQFPWNRALFADGLQAGYSSWVLRRDGVLLGHAVLLSRGTYRLASLVVPTD